MESYTRRDGRFMNLDHIDLSPSAALTTDTASAAYELGGPRGVALTLAVTAVSTDDSLDVTIEASSTGAFGGEERTVATYTQNTAASSQRLSFVGDRFIRAKYNVTGSNVSISCTLKGEAA